MDKLARSSLFSFEKMDELWHLLRLGDDELKDAVDVGLQKRYPMELLRLILSFIQPVRWEMVQSPSLDFTAAYDRWYGWAGSHLVSQIDASRIRILFRMKPDTRWRFYLAHPTSRTLTDLSAIRDHHWYRHISSIDHSAILWDITLTVKHGCVWAYFNHVKGISRNNHQIVNLDPRTEYEPIRIDSFSPDIESWTPRLYSTDPLTHLQVIHND